MIFNIIIYIFLGIFSIVNTILPSWDLPSGFYYYLNQSTTLFHSLNFILAVDTFFTIVILIFSFEIFIFLFKRLSGFISIIRGGGHL